MGAVEMEYQRGAPIMDGESRKYVWYGLLIALTVTLFFAGLWICVVKTHQSDERKMSTIVSACVNSGNLWIDDNCVPSGK